MLKLTKADMATIERQLYNKGRDIDVAIYNALFDPMYKEFIPDSLMLYMTKEGGMGNALEIDNYNPNASVYQTYEALRIFYDLSFTGNEENELYQHMMNKMCNYLYNRCPMTKGLWNPLVKTNDDYAHSNEYSYLEDPYPIWGVHPTAAIVGYILVLAPQNKAYYKKAEKQLPGLIAYFDEKEQWNSYDFISANALLGCLKKGNIYKEEVILLEKKILAEALRHLEDDSFEFAAYLSHAFVNAQLQEKIDKDLDKLILSRKSHGLWENPKGWGTNRYAEADSAALKWLGAQTVKNLSLLKQYGRIEE